QRFLLAAAVRSSVATGALVDALDQGRIKPVEVDPGTRQALERFPDPDLQRRLARLLKNDMSRDRQEVVRRYQPSLTLMADGKHGAALFAKNCLVCHTVQGQGGQVGPDLSGLSSRPKT